MIMPAQVKTNTIHQIKVTLEGSKPLIWRRIQVDSEITLFKLHKILQEVMGWTDSHMHQYFIREKIYSHPDFELGEFENETKVKLKQLVSNENFKFTYVYDFGDGWQHELWVEKIMQGGVKLTPPICLAGEMACPPEDVGGIGGTGISLKPFKNPNIPNTNPCSNRSAAASTRKNLTLKKPTAR